MAKQQACHKFIYKLHSRVLKNAKWNLSLPLEEAMNNANDIVALSDSQILRWILEYRGISDLDEKVSEVKKEIKYLKKLKRNKNVKQQIKGKYKEQYQLQFQPDYMCVIMDSLSHYDRCNEGFAVNGIKYKRLLGTNGGIKKSTIVYVSEEIYPFIKSRIDNGRDMEQKLIPAKLEAYQALVCSGSIPIPTPRMLIVDDCYTTFKENVITIADGDGAEPILEYVNDYEINYDDSDGYGLMTPEYSKIVNHSLYGDEFGETTITGINTRYAWTKGMVYTFDFVEFAKQKNNDTYMVKDAWGEWRDVRDYDVIMTTSQVKLWDSYLSLEDYVEKCNNNHYQFSVAKTTPHKLENARNSNYQFLQTYELTDEQIYELCKPTIDEIKDVLSNDWRKTLAFLRGLNITESQIEYSENDFIKAIMIYPEMVNDPFVINKVHRMIKKKISDAAKGSIKLHGNFSIISGDPYSLCQSIFGLPITGLLKKGEIYAKYWADLNTDRVACFRAPMTCHNNIRVRNVANTDEMKFWYQYNHTGVILNSWDSTCDATNGSDKDGDMFFTTDNSILVNNTRNTPTIECVQKKGIKMIPTEKDIISANKIAFGDEIGTTTNHITAMIEVQAQFPKDTKEYKELEYRIMCGQHLQQASIDKAKGIISKPMPPYWYNRSECAKVFNKDNGYSEEEIAFQFRIIADKKPYFMTYVYPELAKQYRDYIKGSDKKCTRRYNLNVAELREKEEQSSEEKIYIEYYDRLMPVGIHACTINRICWMIEKEFKEFLKQKRRNTDFDYTILKSNTDYTKQMYNQIKLIKDDYDRQMQDIQKLIHKRRYDTDEISSCYEIVNNTYKAKCYSECSNGKELCNILLDMCYTNEKGKQFVWSMCGDVIIDNLLDKFNHTLFYPSHVEDNGEFEYAGEQFVMEKVILERNDENSITE